MASEKNITKSEKNNDKKIQKNGYWREKKLDFQTKNRTFVIIFIFSRIWMFEFFGFLEKISFLVKFLIFLIAWQLFMDFSVFWIWFDIYVKKLLLNL